MAISRRTFLLTGLAATSGLAVGIVFADDKAPAMPPYPHASATDLQPNAWLQVTPDNRIIFQLHKAEMGQGIMTGLITVVAEELGVAPEAIIRQFSGIHPAYLNPLFHLQITNASSSMVTCYQPMREAAATVRLLLLTAAAQDWGVPVAELDTRDGVVIHANSGKKAPCGDFVAIARGLPLPEKPAFKSPDQYRFVGRYNRRLESRDKVNGSAKYGIDITPKGTVVAVVVRCPHFGGRLKNFNADQARAMRGVLDVGPIDDSAVAVVATHYWYARQAADTLDIEWDAGALKGVSSQSIASDQRAALDALEAENNLPIARGSLSVEYTAGYMAHAPMEPMNATVAIDGDKVDLWVSTQAPDIARGAVALSLGCAPDRVTVHGCYLGGGFGRRVIADVAADAAKVAKRFGKPVPVKVIWSREDDLQHDAYRQAVTSRLYAELDGAVVKTWRYCVAGDSLIYNLFHVIRPVIFPPAMPDSEVEKIARKKMESDEKNLERIDEPLYQLGPAKVSQVFVQSGIPVFFWRSVGHSFNTFFLESFMDELAHQAKVESLAFRLKHLAPDSVESKLLKLAAAKAQWGRPKKGRFQGIALEKIKGALLAAVAEVSVRGTAIRVHKIVCTVDIGKVINPDIARTVIESGIVWGLSACLHDQITIADGKVEQSNFHDYALARMDETPEMEVYLVDSERSPVGVGESAVGLVAPAIGNAVFKATGKRLRSLPLKM
ncbi:MAG: molybdopterin-dependent oxidoreductase [Azonexus sp.]|jgi:CO/xanthine dehydrogenase Mo-binding subunit|nr:molybdopterin-dependent oxidoreductase [Azonexus sp.]